IAANMDTVGTFEMAEVLASHQLLTAVHKHYTPDQWAFFIDRVEESLVRQYIAVSTGSGARDAEKLDHLLSRFPQLQFVCIDVANGYSEHFVEFVKRTRERYPDRTIMAGNVVTGEMVEEL